MSKVFKCNSCGKEFSYDSPALERWAETKAMPEQIKCPECFGKKKGVATSKKSEPVSTSTTNPVSNLGVTTMSAKLLKQKYDELCAVFGDNLDEVRDYLGGWTTTLALDATKNNNNSKFKQK